ncbi:MAG: hypothetical protein FD163_2195 [Hyphomonadaceae bacterium]|nr:MAG: hypothetical protein FD128_1036 [Hyphomonadaceae bacterium]KAF0183475.1 MAG: hypothetical protein FD163_2195 [Hyphomonadaceae bacterium]
MSFFDKIKNAIFGNKAHAAPAPSAAVPAAAPAAAAPAAPIDIVPILDHAATLVNFETNWRVSIVDLMKLCGLDSSLANRKELATELGYTGDMSDSATMNVWLHRQVMNKLAANGGHVPADLKD